MDPVNSNINSLKKCLYNTCIYIIIYLTSQLLPRPLCVINFKCPFNNGEIVQSALTSLKSHLKMVCHFL